MGFADTVAVHLARHAPAHVGQHLCLEQLQHAPVAVVRYAVNVFPVLLVQQFVAPAAAEAHVEHVGPFARQERRHVHAIGDAADRVFLRRNLRPDVGRHA